MNKVFILESLSAITKVDFFEVSSEGEFLSEKKTSNPICSNESLWKDLLKGCQAQKVPYIKRDENGVFWCSIACNDSYILCGPVSLYPMNVVETHRFYYSYLVHEENEKPVPFMNFSEYLLMIRHLCNVLLDIMFDDDILVSENHLSVFEFDGKEEGLILHDLHDDNIIHHHHTYQDERKIWQYLQNGDYEKVYHWNYQLINDMEVLSDDRNVHWYNMAIVAITICTRAAIEGGMPALQAYRLSGFYIQKLNVNDDVMQIQNVMNAALKDLTLKTAEWSKKQHYTSYVERCKDYIKNHYKEKIRMEVIADALGISRTYLSRIFKKETGISWQEYVIRFRVERAANMLRYSNESIAYISDYTGFPTQSYFGEKFKKYMGMTPFEYRKKYKPVDF